MKGTITAQSSVSDLIRLEVLYHPIKHAAVSLALAWRGMFINNYWGVFGWIAAMIILRRAIREWDKPVLLLFLPACLMVAFHASVSVSIPRYNILLIPALSFAMAIIITDIMKQLGLAQRFEQTYKKHFRFLEQNTP